MKQPAAAHIVNPNRHGTPTDMDFLLDQSADSLRNTKFSASMASVLSVDRVDLCQPAEDLPVEQLKLWTEDYVDPTPSSMEHGFAHRTSAPSTFMNTRMLEFVIFLQQRGTVGGTKTLPSEAEQAMRWRGTPHGATIFNSSAEDVAMMAPSATSARFFRLRELRDGQQLKQYLRKSVAELTAQLDRLRQKEEEDAKQQIDPLRKAIFTQLAASGTARTKLNMLKTNLTAAQLVLFQDQMALFAPEAKVPLSVLRQTMLDIVVSLGPRAVDLQVFNIVLPEEQPQQEEQEEG